tara:strand:- start:43314 stop:44438 length:1125 start_codon:yes stop_codon:yes gene_type:complete
MSQKPFKDLKVCVIGPVPPPAGGMANQTAELCRLLRLEQSQVTLVATNAPYSPVWVGEIRGIRALFRLIPYLYRLRQALKQADVAHLLANSGWSWHLFAAPAVWIAHWVGTPIVLNYRGGHAESFFATSWRWVAPTLKRASTCTVPSLFLAEVFSQRQVSTRIIPNTLDQELFYPPEQQPANRRDIEQNQTPGPLLIITRNLETIYGIDLAIRAMPEILTIHPNARLVIAGSGPEQQALESLAESLGIIQQIEFCGRLGRQQIASLYRQADLMINPSRIDNSPNSIIEALGSGLPVVSTRAGGIPKLVKHDETALLVDLESPEAIAKATLQLLADPELRHRYSENGIEFSRRFQWQQVKTDLLQVYQQAQDGSV